MEVANTLAYYDTETITAVKSFIVQAPEVINSAVKSFKIQTLRGVTLQSKNYIVQGPML